MLAKSKSIAIERDLAIKNYKKSPELNPANENAKKMLKQLTLNGVH